MPTGMEIDDAAVHVLRNAGQTGLSLDPQALATGQNGGYQAINFAVLAGARRIVLLGYDGRFGADGRGHWFGEHPQPYATRQQELEMYVKNFRGLPQPLADAGVEVLNASPGTAIDAFRKVTLDDALEGVAADPPGA
jgi:hypothetical protein